MSKSRFPSYLYYAAPQSEIKTSYTKVNSNWQFSAKKYLETGGKGPYWVANSPKDTNTKKRRLLFSTQAHNTIHQIKQVGTALLQDGFEIEYFNSKGELSSLNIEDLESGITAEGIDLLTMNEVTARTRLLSVGKDPDKYAIIDQYRFVCIFNIVRPRAMISYKAEYKSNLSKFNSENRLNKIETLDFNFTEFDDGSVFKKITEVMPHLNHLRIYNSPISLQHIPSQVIYLELYDCALNESSFRQLPRNLRLLSINNCKCFKELDFSIFPNLKKIIVHTTADMSLKKFPAQLEYLELAGPIKCEIPKNIKSITIYDNDVVESVDFAEYDKLDIMVFLNCENFKEVTNFPKNMSLGEIEKCPQFMATDVTKALKDTLTLIDCGNPSNKVAKSKLGFDIDSKTFTPSNTLLKITMAIYAGPELKLIAPANYRLNVYSQIVIKNEKIQIDSTDHHWQEIKSTSTEDKITTNDFLIEMPITTKDLIILPMLSHNCTIKKIPEGAKIYKDEVTQEYAIQFKRIPSGKINIIVTEDKSLSVKTTVLPTLDDEIILKLKDLFSLNMIDNEWQTQFESVKMKTQAEKIDFCINELPKYFIDFLNLELDREDTKDLSPILRILVEKKGACRHRASAYVLMCQYLDVPARYIENEVHAYAEIFDGKNWIKQDLGGARAESTPLPEKPTSLKQREKKLSVSEVEQPVNLSVPFEKYFYPNLAIPSTVTTTQGMLDWLVTQETNILVKLSSFEFAKDLNTALAQRASAKKIPFFYIESPEDINDFLKLKTLEKNGLITETEGPLADFLKIKEGGILAINWGRFTPEQIARYKSIMDAPPITPKLEQYVLSNKIKIINLMTEESHACEALYSRVDLVAWPEKIPLPEPLPPIPVKPFEKKGVTQDALHEIFLPNGDQWQAELIGESIIDDGFKFIPGQLGQAKKGVKIINPPIDNVKFQAFINRLRIDHTYLENGKIKKVPPDFEIEYVFIDPKLVKRPKECEIKKDEIKPSTHDIFYLHPENFANFIRATQQVIQDKKMHTLPNWLYDKDFKKIKTIALIQPLLPNQEAELNYHLTKLKDDGVKFINLSDEQCIVKTFDPINLKAPGAHLIQTSDPDFVAAQLKTSATMMQPIYATTDSSTITETIEIKIINNIPNFLHTSQAIINDLIKGRDVILYGTLSQDLYLALETLFQNPPYVKLSHSKDPIPVSGKLFIVTTPPTFAVNRAALHQQHHYFDELQLWQEYKNKLSIHPAYKEYGDKIWQLHEYIKTYIKHNTQGAPEKPFLSYNRLKYMLDVLWEQKMPVDHELIKSLFLYNDYDKDTESACRLNVYIKMLFASNLDLKKPGVRTKKLAEYPSNSNYLWRRLNCLDANALHELKELTEKNLNVFISEGKFIPIKKNSDPQKKIIKKMHYHLEHRNAVVLKGPPGSGKTFTANTCYADYQLFTGEQMIQSFLKSKPTKDKPSVLLIDEANLDSPGTWDFLKSHILGGKAGSSVTYKGQTYLLNQYFKIIFTCNPESYPNRYYHTILQETPTVYVKAWTDETIKNNVLHPLIHSVFKNSKQSLSVKALGNLDNILKMYHWVEKNLPPNSLSLRDLQQVTRRWLYLIKEGVEPSQAAYEATCYEWAHRFLEPTKKIDFKKAADYTFPTKQALSLHIKGEVIADKLPKHMYLSLNQKHLLAELQQDILLSESTHDEKTKDGASSVKLGYLLEGPSGFGKSSLSYELLKLMNYHEIKLSSELEDKKKDFRRSFIQFTLTGNLMEDQALLLKAFNAGCKIIIDELNLDPEIEILLNHLLTGKTPEGLPPEHKGFYILASQNSSHLPGRRSSPPALLNRLHVYYLEDYTRDELMEIVKTACKDVPIPEPIIQHIVEAYESLKNRYPDSVNARKFFHGLKKFLTDIKHSEKVYFEFLAGCFDSSREEKLKIDPVPFSAIKDPMIASIEAKIVTLKDKDLSKKATQLSVVLDKFSKLDLRDSHALNDFKTFINSKSVQQVLLEPSGNKQGMFSKTLDFELKQFVNDIWLFIEKNAFAVVASENSKNLRMR